MTHSDTIYDRQSDDVIQISTDVDTVATRTHALEVGEVIAPGDMCSSGTWVTHVHTITEDVADELRTQSSHAPGEQTTARALVEGHHIHNSGSSCAYTAMSHGTMAHDTASVACSSTSLPNTSATLESDTRCGKVTSSVSPNPALRTHADEHGTVNAHVSAPHTTHTTSPCTVTRTVCDCLPRNPDDDAVGCEAMSVAHPTHNRFADNDTDVNKSNHNHYHGTSNNHSSNCNKETSKEEYGEHVDRPNAPTHTTHYHLRHVGPLTFTHSDWTSGSDSLGDEFTAAAEQAQRQSLLLRRHHRENDARDVEERRIGGMQRRWRSTQPHTCAALTIDTALGASEENAASASLSLCGTVYEQTQARQMRHVATHEDAEQRHAHASSGAVQETPDINSNNNNIINHNYNNVHDNNDNNAAPDSTKNTTQMRDTKGTCDEDDGRATSGRHKNRCSSFDVWASDAGRYYAHGSMGSPTTYLLSTAQQQRQQQQQMVQRQQQQLLVLQDAMNGQAGVEEKEHEQHNDKTPVSSRQARFTIDVQDNETNEVRERVVYDIQDEEDASAITNEHNNNNNADVGSKVDATYHDTSVITTTATATTTNNNNKVADGSLNEQASHVEVTQSEVKGVIRISDDVSASDAASANTEATVPEPVAPATAPHAPLLTAKEDEEEQQQEQQQQQQDTLGRVHEDDTQTGLRPLRKRLKLTLQHPAAPPSESKAAPTFSAEEEQADVKRVKLRLVRVRETAAETRDCSDKPAEDTKESSRRPQGLDMNNNNNNNNNNSQSNGYAEARAAQDETSHVHHSSSRDARRPRQTGTMAASFSPLTPHTRTTTLPSFVDATATNSMTSNLLSSGTPKPTATLSDSITQTAHTATGVVVNTELEKDEMSEGTRSTRCHVTRVPNQSLQTVNNSHNTSTTTTTTDNNNNNNAGAESSNDNRSRSNNNNDNTTSAITTTTAATTTTNNNNSNHISRFFARSNSDPLAAGRSSHTAHTPAAAPPPPPCLFTTQSLPHHDSLAASQYMASPGLSPSPYYTATATLTGARRVHKETRIPLPLTPAPVDFGSLRHTLEDRYSCARKVSEGTYGEVYLGTDKRTGDCVALKRLKTLRGLDGFPITSLREVIALQHIQKQRARLTALPLHTHAVNNSNNNNNNNSSNNDNATCCTVSATSVQDGGTHVATHDHTCTRAHEVLLPSASSASHVTGTAVSHADPLSDFVALRDVLISTQGGTHDIVLVFDYCVGSMAGLVARRFPFTLPEVAYIFRRLVMATAKLHAMGIIHRDIKSDNVLLSHDGGVKLADFGLCVFSHAGSRALTPSMINLAYRPPEMLLGSVTYDAKVDVWSIGCFLAQVFLGTPPFYRAGKPRSSNNNNTNNTTTSGRGVVTELEQLALVCEVLGPMSASVLEGFSPTTCKHLATLRCVREYYYSRHSGNGGGSSITSSNSSNNPLNSTLLSARSRNRGSSSNNCEEDDAASASLMRGVEQLQPLFEESFLYTRYGGFRDWFLAALENRRARHAAAAAAATSHIDTNGDSKRAVPPVLIPSPTCLDVICAIFQLDPRRRPTAAELLQMPFFQLGTDSSTHSSLSSSSSSCLPFGSRSARFGAASLAAAYGSPHSAAMYGRGSQSVAGQPENMGAGSTSALEMTLLREQEIRRMLTAKLTEFPDSHLIPRTV